MDVAPYLGELPEAVEQAILLGLGEAELLACAELGHASLSVAARDDTYWRHHFEKRLKGSPLTDSAGITYFERAVCARHLDTFRKPPALANEVSMLVPPVQILPALRNDGVELVLVCVGKSGQIALRGTDPESTLLAEWEAESFLLPEPAEPLLPDTTVQPEEPLEWGDALESVPRPSPDVLEAAPQAEKKEVGPDEDEEVAVNVRTRKQKKKKGKKVGDPSASAAITPESSPAFSPMLRPSHPSKQNPGSARCTGGSPSVTSPSERVPSLQSSTALAAEVVQSGIVAVSACKSEWLNNNGSSSSAVRVLRVDKWGDVWRGRFVVATVCPWPDSAAACQASVLSCSIFGNGRYAVAGTDQCGTLVWDLEGVEALPICSAGATPVQARKKEGRGPCFRCGQTGHWAASCPSVTKEGQSSIADHNVSETLASPLSLPLACSDGAVGPMPNVLFEGLGPIVDVAGTLLLASDVGSDHVPLVFSATASKILAHVSDGQSWRCLFMVNASDAADAPAIGPILSLYTPDLAAQDAAKLGTQGCFVWAACEHGVVLTGASSLVLGNSGWHADRSTTGARAFNANISAVLYMQRPAGLLCGLADGRLFHCRLRAEAAGGCTANVAAGADAVGEAVAGPENAGEPKTIIKCKAVGGSAPSKSVAITSLAADQRLPVVLSGDSQGSVKIWDSISWRCLRTLPYFGQGSVTSLSLLVCAPLRGVAAVTEKAKETRLHVTWFGRKPLPRLRPQGNPACGSREQKAKRQYTENPGKASTFGDSRVTVANTRKQDMGYGDKGYQHRGVGRKERRDLAARVKVQRPGAVGTVGSVGNMSAPLFESVDVQVLNTGSTQISNASHHSHWEQGEADAYDDYDYYGDGVDEAAWQYEEDWE